MPVSNGLLLESPGSDYSYIDVNAEKTSIPITLLSPGAGLESINCSFRVATEAVGGYTPFETPYVVAALALTDSGDPNQQPPTPGNPAGLAPPDMYLAFQTMSVMSSSGGTKLVFGGESKLVGEFSPGGPLVFNVSRPFYSHNSQIALYFALGTNQPIGFEQWSLKLTIAYRYWTRGIPQ